MLNFLNNYSHAVNLDDERFDDVFTQGIKRADFLLFNEVVCEVKEVKKFNAKKRVSHLFNKESFKESFKRDFYNFFSKVLSDANKQIQETRKALDTQDALGLIIIENQIQNDLSVLTLIDAADRKMQSGLECVDAVLCIDSVNTFIDANGSLFFPMQIVARDSGRAKKLCNLVDDLINAFAESRGTTVRNNFNISSANQKWVVDANGVYKYYEATIYE